MRRIDTARGDPFLSAATAALNISAPRSTLFACKKALELVAGVNPRIGFTLTLEEESAADGREIKRMMTVVKVCFLRTLPSEFVLTLVAQWTGRIAHQAFWNSARLIVD